MAERWIDLDDEQEPEGDEYEQVQQQIEAIQRLCYAIEALTRKLGELEGK